jgi:hypothetical protein
MVLKVILAKAVRARKTPASVRTSAAKAMSFTFGLLD